MKMMAIAGPSGRESAIMRFITEALCRAGLAKSAFKFDHAHRHSPFEGCCGNLIVKLPGTGRLRRAPRRLLMAHVDTVPICVASKPVRQGGWIRSGRHDTGLGADNRSGAAAVLHAAVSILEKKLAHPPLTLLWTVQEEVGLIGARHVSIRDLGKPRLAFNFDSGAPEKLIIGATGAYRMTIDVEGIASHAGVHPDMGVSAVVIASLAIAQLHKDGYLGTVCKGRRTGTSNIGVIQGGQATNVVTPHVRLAAELRSHNPTFRNVILDRFRRAFQRAARQVRNKAGACGKIRFDVRIDYEAFKLNRREAAVVAARDAAQAVTGRTPEMTIVNGGLDANWLTCRGIATVTLGAGQHGAHTVDEVLNISEFLGGCRMAVRLATATDEPASP